MELTPPALRLPEPGGRIPEEQLVYATWLGAGTRIGLGLLIATFAVYMAGILPPHVDFAALPRLWTLPVDSYLAATGLPSGWGWLAFLGRGDLLNFTGIAFLSLVTLGCYLRVALLFLQRGDLVFFLIALAEIGVLALAASGFAGGRH